MSIQHVSLVLDCRDEQLNSARRMVLVALANRADADDICWPRQELIAEEAGMSVRSLQDHLAALVELGYLERETRARGQGRGSKTHYRLVTAKLRGANSADANPDDLDTRNSAPQLRHARFAGANFVGLDTRNSASQEPTLEPTIGRGKREREPFEHFWSAYPKRITESGRAVKVGRPQAEAQWKRLTLDDQRAAYRGLRVYAEAAGSKPVDAERYLKRRLWVGLECEQAPITAPVPARSRSPDRPSRSAAILDRVFGETP